MNTEQLISNAEWSKLDIAKRDKCKLVLLRLSLAKNLEKPVMGAWLPPLRAKRISLCSVCKSDQWETEFL
jgi:hypothetical protein